MRRFVEGVDRGQTALFPECLADWIGEDNPVRVVDVFVEGRLAELPDQNCYASPLPAKRFYNANITVTLKGRRRVSAAEGVRAAVLANAGIAIASEWMFAPEIKDGTIKIVLRGWTLPQIDLWAVFPAGRTTAKARRIAIGCGEIHRPAVESWGFVQEATTLSFR